MSWEKQILLLLPVKYNISPILIVRFSNCKTPASAQMEKYSNSLVAKGESMSLIVLYVKSFLVEA
jgi:hypothetical protein